MKRVLEELASSCKLCSIEYVPISVGGRELAVLPEWLLEVRVGYLEEAGVNVCEDVLLGPLDSCQ